MFHLRSKMASFCVQKEAICVVGRGIFARESVVRHLAGSIAQSSEFTRELTLAWASPLEKHENQSEGGKHGTPAQNSAESRAGSLKHAGRSGSRTTGR